MEEYLHVKDRDSFHFFKNLLLVVSFFALTPIVIAVSIFSIFSFGQNSKGQTVLASEPTMPGVRVYASLPAIRPSITSEVVAADARSEILRHYLTRYDSPLVPYAQTLVDAADEYGLDFRLLTAIAQQESNLCKKIPEGSYNCWGWGIHSRGTLGFASFEEGIWTVTEGIKKSYVDKGFTTVEKIMTKYTPSSNGSWASGVTQFMNEME